MKRSDTLNHSSDHRQRFLRTVLRRKNWLIVLSFAALGFVLPMFYAYFNGFPVPQVHDELSYLLAADTFAHGKITNPTPAFPEHFETPHILVEPSYMSKYPPLQGLALALGQVVFGKPIFGVWVTCGMAAAALFWMLSAWTRPRWAIFGTLMMISFIGINSYWAQSHWGGMIATTGGALFLGGFRRLFKEISIGSTLLMVLGGIILVNSRPFEGTAMMFPAILVLLIWLIRDRKASFGHKFTQIILPGALLTATALSVMGYYNYRVTGNALKFAYTAHQSQYFSTPLFIFQEPQKSELKGTPRLQKLYNYLHCSSLIRDLDWYALPDIVYLYPVYAIFFLVFNVPFFLLSIPLSFFLYFTVFLLIFKDRWMLFIFGTILFAFGCMSIVAYWDCMHYSAPLTACFYLLTVEGLRFCLIAGKKSKKKGQTMALLIFLMGGALIYQITYIPDFFFPVKSTSRYKDFSDINLKFDKPVTLSIPDKITYLKPVIENAANNLPGNYLAIVSYDPNYDIHDEIVFNKADIENSKLIWAYDLGEEKNKALINYYSNRKILRIKITDASMEITPEE